MLIAISFVCLCMVVGVRGVGGVVGGSNSLQIWQLFSVLAHLGSWEVRVGRGVRKCA